MIIFTRVLSAVKNTESVDKWILDRVLMNKESEILDRWCINNKLSIIRYTCTYRKKSKTYSFNIRFDPTKIDSSFFNVLREINITTLYGTFLNSSRQIAVYRIYVIQDTNLAKIVIDDVNIYLNTLTFTPYYNKDTPENFVVGFSKEAKELLLRNKTPSFLWNLYLKDYCT